MLISHEICSPSEKFIVQCLAIAGQRKIKQPIYFKIEKEKSELDLLISFSLPPKLLDKSEIKYLNSLKSLKTGKDPFLILLLLLSQKIKSL